MEASKNFRSWNAVSLIIAILLWSSSVIGSKDILVGGEQGWRFGTNYTEWASKSSPFYVNDTLVFKYPLPTSGFSPHMVVLLKNKQTFKACDLVGARLLAGPKGGSGKGYRFKLKKAQNYFFACGEENGTHCNQGLMKFGVRPVLPKAS